MKDIPSAETSIRTDNPNNKTDRRRKHTSPEYILLQARLNKGLGRFVQELTIYNNMPGPFTMSQFVKDLVIMIKQHYENNPKKLEEFLGKNLFMKYFSDITLKETKTKIREDIHDGNN